MLVHDDMGEAQAIERALLDGAMLAAAVFFCWRDPNLQVSKLAPGQQRKKLAPTLNVWNINGWANKESSINNGSLRIGFLQVGGRKHLAISISLVGWWWDVVSSGAMPTSCLQIPICKNISTKARANTGVDISYPYRSTFHNTRWFNLSQNLCVFYFVCIRHMVWILLNEQ